YEWMAIRYPQGPKEAVDIEVLERGAAHPNAKSYIYLDARSGEALGVKRYATDIPLGRKIYLWIIALHAGLVGGFVYQLALLIAALAIPVQAYSGIVPWFRRKFGAAPGEAMIKVRVAKIREEALDIKSFELVKANGKALP